MHYLGTQTELGSLGGLESLLEKSEKNSRKLCCGRGKTVLFIMHEERTCSGSVGQWFQNQGYTIEIRKPRWGDSLPKTLHGYEGVVVFGGNMSVNDPLDYIKTEIDWLAVPLQENVPLLGICLGAQLLVKHLGGDVFGRSDGRIEAGYYPVKPVRDSSICDPSLFPKMVYEWHSEGFGLPAGMECFLKGQSFENQAVLYDGCHVGFQFHPEITERILRRWVTLLPDMLQNEGSQSVLEQISGHIRWQYQSRLWLNLFLTAWCNKTVATCVKS